MEAIRQHLQWITEGTTVQAIIKTISICAFILMIIYFILKMPVSAIMFVFSLTLFFRQELMNSIREDVPPVNTTNSADLKVPTLNVPPVNTTSSADLKVSPMNVPPVNTTSRTEKEKNLSSDNLLMQPKYLEDIERAPALSALKGLDELGLTEYYPSKISLEDVMAVQNRNNKVKSDIPWLILQKLIMLDYKGRESDICKSIDSDNDGNMGNQDEYEDFLSTLAPEEEVKGTLNPLDVFFLTYSCCDVALKQILAQKMFSCRLAVPFISPQLSGEGLVYSLWALRGIIVEWKNKDQVCMETSVVSQPVKTISFLKLGEPSSSKSDLLNNVLSDQPHHTFWNRECPLGESEHPLANGLVEAQWYLPSGLPNDIFEDVTMFLNLRGDACEHKKQLQVLEKISNAVVCCVDPADLESSVEVRDTMKRIHESSVNVVLLLQMKELNAQKVHEQLESYFTFVGTSYKDTTKIISGIKGKKVRTMEDLRKEVRKSLKALAVQGVLSIEDASSMAKVTGIVIDEDEEFCKSAKELAIQLKQCITLVSTIVGKQEMLPLQGKCWEELSKLQKAKQTVGSKDMKSNTHNEISKIDTAMKSLQEVQLKHCTNLSTLVKTFLKHLVMLRDSPVAILYLQWVKIYLDEISRKVIPPLQHQYHEKWKQLADSENKAKKMSDDPTRDEIMSTPGEKATCLREELATIEKTLVDASLGVEHLFREVGQIYEATQNDRSMRQAVEKLPNVVANLMLKGHPMEIMDGDAANVPMIWVDAVFKELKNILGEKKLFVISVLGIQSSGKSTLLNTMFGLQFAVSAGRCTRGVYMQLIKVDKERSDLPYDYVLVVDTEGLRAPELGQLKHDNDNQLATFVIGLGDVTLLNIKGENVSEISDVLQIAVHAFVRMKISKNNFQANRTCYFIHQNVPAINAKSKMQQGTKKLQEKLDKMTVEACTMESIIDIQCFNQVIKFDSETNVWYFPDLWYGDPPMAPVNTGYTATVQEVRHHLLNHLGKKGETHLNFSDMSLHIKDLWRAVQSENFVFSFRNSLAVKAYSSLEGRYHEQSWKVESRITEWLTQTAAVKLERCRTKDKLDSKHSELLTELTKIVCDLQETAHNELEQYIDSHNLKDILIEWKVQKLNGLQIDINLFLDTARSKLLQEKKNVAAQLHQNAKLADLDGGIMQKARQFAIESNGQQADDSQLVMMFDKFWGESVAELLPKSNETVTKVDFIVEQILYRNITKDKAYLRDELDRQSLSDIPLSIGLENSINIEDVKQSDLSIKTSWKNFFQTKTSVSDLQANAVRVINTILGRVEGYLSDISRKDSDFQEAYATNVIKIVVDGIEKHNSKPTSGDFFTLRANLKVRMVVHACRHAVRTFNKMAATYKERHSLSKQLDTKKAAAWCLFRNTVKQRASEVIAADLFVAHLESLIRKAVQRDMTVKVVDEIVRYFSCQKFSLLIKIFGDLAEGDFERYKSFIRDTKGFGLCWITSFTQKEIFVEKGEDYSKYVKFATESTRKLVESIGEAIRSTNKAIKRQEYPDIEKWVNTFCATLEELPVTKEGLCHMMKEGIDDFESMEKCLLGNLEPMEYKLQSVFNAETPDSIKWEGETPYKQILDRLWGCEARCPFCGEVCQRTDANHLSPNDCHQCIQHRPQGVNGISWESDDEQNQKLCLETCNFNVQSIITRFGRNGQWHPYREYKKHEPNWDIAPSPTMESSKYWLWFMATYKHELAEWYNHKVPDVPEAWHQITKQEALDSLCVYYN